MDTKLAFTETDGGFGLTLRAAAEFLSKKDYVDNWRSEMNEEFCFWSFTQWREVLGDVGEEDLAAAYELGGTIAALLTD